MNLPTQSIWFSGDVMGSGLPALLYAVMNKGDRIMATPRLSLPLLFQLLCLSL